jgi:hypothetical protein
VPKISLNPPQKLNPSVANWQAFNEGLPWLASAEYPPLVRPTAKGWFCHVDEFW